MTGKNHFWPCQSCRPDPYIYHYEKTKSMHQFGLQNFRVVHLRKTFALFLIFLLFSCADKNAAESEKVAESNKTPPAVLKESGESKQFFFENGVVKEEVNYQNGKLDGVSKKYYNNGKVRYERFYEDGKLITENEKLYYANGALLIEKNYTHGKLHGICRTFFDNGQLHDEAHFENGDQTGPSLRYYMNGQVLSECTPDDKTNEEVCRNFYDNGNIESERRFFKGTRHSSAPRKTFYRSGTLKTIGNVLDGFGLYQTFYENGNIKKEIIYKADDVSISNGYYPNGQLKETKRIKGQYKDGVASLYDSDGGLATEQIWQDGTLVDEIYYE